jgi:hypothetical protein
MKSDIYAKPLLLADVDDPVFQKLFWSHVITSGYCWEWAGGKTKRDTGAFGSMVSYTERTALVTSQLTCAYLNQCLFFTLAITHRV